MSKEVKILFVDDEKNNLESFKANFRRDFKIYLAESGPEGLEIFKQQEDLNIILTDQRMPEMTGIEFLVEVQKINPEPMRILITGYTDINAVIDAINKGQVYRYLTKPWEYEDLKATIFNAHEVYRLRRENRELLDKLKRANEQLEFLLRQKLLS